MRTASEPNPPVTFANENVQQLAFTGNYQLAMANSRVSPTATRRSSSSRSQIKTLAWDTAYTIFGQLLTGVIPSIRWPLSRSSINLDENLAAGQPVTISSATLTSTNPNGVLIIDTTQATQNQTSTITVTAKNPTNGSTTTQSFLVTVSAYGGPTSGPDLT